MGICFTGIKRLWWFLIFRVKLFEIIILMKLSKIYEPQQYEPNIYMLWEKANAFAPVPNTADTYSITLPPPNANGNLHLGHALTVAIEDVLARYNRMQGKSTLYLPGADHAGFETWVVFERNLEKEGKSRFDFSREELYTMVWDFVEKQRGNMEIQLRELGASLDWNNTTFTLDKKVVQTAYRTFKKMWDDGLVYRGERLVNYCTKHHTGFADIEVEYEDRKTPLYYLKYGPFTLATTRPETKFGDTGVAVHPGDERYKQYVGKEIEVQGVNGPFTVRVVADEHVDPHFGTGAVKITPAHDFNDWDIAKRHNLPAIKVIDLDGKLTERAGRFAGMTVLEARKAVVQALQQKDLLVKVDDTYENRVGVCYKCKTVIEPMLMDQWFVRVAPLVQKVTAAIVDKKVTFTPENKGEVLIHYLNNLRDWNISRQPAWGIPIPAFQNIDDPKDWIFDTRVDQEAIQVNAKTYKRDPDTFDTWFSSSQWPFITTDFLDGGELAKFYPLDVMETGHDLLYAWVARMLMFGLYCTNQVPFKHVYLHGMVLDEHGQKMSKSKGNVMNPQDFVQQYGSDALRMGLLANRSAGVNQAFSTGKVVAGRNFCNKLWNMARYLEDKIADDYHNRQPKPQTIADHWVLQRLEQAGQEIARLIEGYRFSEAFETMYHLVWDDVADWYLEASKVSSQPAMLAHVLETILTLAHPFAPFVTETIWQTLAWEKQMLMTTHWPDRAGEYDATAAQQFSDLQAIISETRFVATELGQGKQRLIFMDDPLIDQHAALIQHLAHLTSVEKIAQPRGLRLAIAKHQAWLDIDVATLTKHRSKLEARLADCTQQISHLELRLANKNYVDHAPKNVVQQTRQQLAEQQTLKERLERELTVLKPSAS